MNTSGCVKVLTNFYSVPLPVSLEVHAKVHSAYEETLTKKPGAFAGSTALEQ